MLYYDRIDISEDSDVNKTCVSKECIICHYWYFLYEGFKFQPYVFNGCYYVLMSLNFSNVAILNTEDIDYCCIINRISKREAVNLQQDADLNEKSGAL